MLHTVLIALFLLACAAVEAMHDRTAPLTFACSDKNLTAGFACTCAQHSHACANAYTRSKRSAWYMMYLSIYSADNSTGRHDACVEAAANGRLHTALTMANYG